ncbi:MAG: hypothetical protein QOC60_283 [Frankiaceae bacterium]|nr:hypothetical protein [Frankiaceae bacterium]
MTLATVAARSDGKYATTTPPRTALRHRSVGLADLGPNWFAGVMGTGIVATAAVTLPVHVPGLRGFALAVWVLASFLLASLIYATAAQWLRHPVAARAHLNDPVMSHFYGAPPMAVLTVGAGAILVGRDVLGLRLAVDLDWVMWLIGTATGLAVAAVVPYVAFTRHDTKPDSAFGGWLMPVVPPMVSASTGALLVPYAAAGQLRETLLAACYCMFGLSLFASVVIIGLIWGRLMQHKVGSPAAVPTLWIVLGPLGQSITAAGLMATAARGTLPTVDADGAAAMAMLFGLTTWGFAVLWLTVAIAVTARTARAHLPFSLTWWSFAFPVGALVTGTNGLAVRTGLAFFAGASVLLYALLVLAWLTVSARTLSAIAMGTLPAPAVVGAREA